MKLVQAIMLLLCVHAVALADLKVTRKVGSGSYGGQSTVYIKGARQRTENPGMTTIQQCDLKRTIQINDRTRKYMIVPDETEAAQSAAASAPAPQGPRQTRRGAIVTQTETIVDTGERKTIFGYTARHIKTTSVMDAPPEACNPGHLETESDGWYIDLAAGFSCDTSRPAAPPMRGARPDCVDQVRFKRTGTARLGFPVSVTTKIKMGEGGDDAEASAMTGGGMTNTNEVTDISTVTLDPALFDIPAGYTEAASMQELYAAPSGMADITGAMSGGRPPEAVAPSKSAAPAAIARPKAPGAIRVGVAAINNRAGGEVSLGELRAGLVGSISGEGLEAVPLDASEQAAADAEAKQKDCDFVLLTDLSALKQSAAGKLGGMFGRAAGVSTPGSEKYESRVDFHLYATGGASQLDSNATAKEEGALASVSAALEREARSVVAAARKKK